MKINSILFFVLVFLTSSAFAQELVSYNTFGNTGSETNEPPAATAANLTASNLTLVGITTSANANRFGGSSWAVGNTLNVTNDYISLTITPTAGFSFSVTSIVVFLDRSATGPTNFTFRSSSDSFATDLFTPIFRNNTGPIGTTNLVAGLNNISSSLELRLFGYNSGASGGTGGIDVTNNTAGLVIFGTVTAPGSAPSITTISATQIGASTSTVGGDVTSDGGSTITNRGVSFGTTTGIGINSNKTSTSGTTGSYTIDLASLSANTRYYYRAYAQNAAGTTLGGESNFVTLANIPGAPTVGGATTNSLNVSINANGNSAATEFAIQVTNDNSYVQLDGTLGGSEAWTNLAGWGTKTVTGLSPNTTYGFRVKARNLDNIETAFGSVTDAATINPSAPTINVTGDPVTLAFGSVVANSTSATQSFDVAGANLTADISITAPSNFEITTNTASGFGSSVTLPPSGGTVGTTTIFVRFLPTAVTGYTNTITVSSTGAGTVNVTATGAGTLAAEPTIHPTNLAFSAIQTTQMTISWTSGNGESHLVLVSSNSTPSTSPTDGTSYSANTFFGSGDALGNAFVVYNGSDTNVIITGLLPGSNYFVRVFEFNGTGITANYLISGSPLSGSSPTIPEASVSLAATNVTVSSFHANWNSSAGATNYQLDASTDSSFGSFVSGYNSRRAGLVTTFSVTGLAPNVTYFYRVRAQNAGGASANSTTQTVTTLAALASVTTTPVSAIGTTSAQSGGNVTSTGGVEVTSRGICWNTIGSPTLNDALTSDGAGGGLFTSSISSLTPGQTYYVRAYAVNSVGTNYGNQQIFSTFCFTNGIVSLTASPNGNTEFTANWSAVSEATGYRIDVSTNNTFSKLVSVTASDLFISEYVEGASNEKYVEIFNGTGADVDLSGYALLLYANGSASTSASNQLSGILTNRGVIAYRNTTATNTQWAILSSANFNGDDAIAIWKRSSSSYVDIFGRIGEDPGTAWTNGAFSTVDKTLVRKSTIRFGVTNNPASGFPTLATEWDQYSISDQSNLGSHSFTDAENQESFISGYSNTTVATTSVTVTGVTTNVTYYYRVRPERSGTCVGDNSATASIIITPPTVGPVTYSRAFGQSFKLLASALTTNSSDAGGGPLTTVWVSSTSSNGHPVSLSDGWVYYTPPANSNTTDFFSFRVANTNGVFAESVATILVNPPVTNSASIATIIPTNGNSYFRWSGIVGRTNNIEGATALGPEPAANWSNIGQAVIGSLGYAEFIETNPPSPRYYRILEAP